MLIEFNFKNFLSFKDETRLSMVASHAKELEESHTIKHDIKKGIANRILTCAALLGANASGKTNMLLAFAFMRSLVLNSAKESQSDELIPVTPFLLNAETRHNPSCFEVTFLKNQAQYRYGFEVDGKKIHREWLFKSTSSREAKLFIREFQAFQLGPQMKNARDLIDKTRDNALFISVASQWNNLVGKEVLKWFQQSLFISGIDDEDYRYVILDMLQKNPSLKDIIVKYLQVADLNIESFNVRSIQESLKDLPKKAREKFEEFAKKSDIDIEASSVVEFSHPIFNDKGEKVDFIEFNLTTQESDGTQKYFAILGPILNAIRNGSVLVIDELDSRFHSLLISFILKLFNSKKTNPNNAQLIFSTQNTKPLNKKELRRDQIWFVEKDRYASSRLIPLLAYKPRQDRIIEKDYLSGRYGGIPNIKYRDIFSNRKQEESEYQELMELEKKLLEETSSDK